MIPVPRGEVVRARLEWALLVVGCAVHAWLVPHAVGGDGYTRYETLVKLVDEGTLSPARYSIVQSLLAWPWFTVGGWLGDRKAGTAYFAISVFLATVAACWFLLRRRVDADVLRRTLLLLVAASMFGRHIQTFYGETLTACGAILGVVLLALDRPGWAGLAMVVAVVNTPAAAPGLGLCNLLWLVRTRRLGHAAWPLVVSVALVMLEFQLRRGSPFRSGYEGDAGFPTVLPFSGRSGFSYPWVLGALSLLFSFGKGLLFFAPGAALQAVAPAAPPGDVEHRIRTGALAFTAGLVIAYAPWWSWYGGWFWGPRFLLFASFLACVVLARHASVLPTSVLGRTGVALAVPLSAWVGVNGSVFHQGGMEVCQQNRYQLEFLCWYVPEFSALVRPFIAPRALLGWELVVVFHGVLVGVVLGWPAWGALVRDARGALLRAWRPPGVST